MIVVPDVEGVTSGGGLIFIIFGCVGWLSRGINVSVAKVPFEGGAGVNSGGDIAVGDINGDSSSDVIRGAYLANGGSRLFGPKMGRASGGEGGGG